MYVFSVAQICNLLYRRIVFCGTWASAGGARTFDRFADCKSAIRQIANLRYEAALCAKHIPARNVPAFEGRLLSHSNWPFAVMAQSNIANCILNSITFKHRISEYLPKNLRIWHLEEAAHNAGTACACELCLRVHEVMLTSL
jgi:hypothetical protein